MTPEVKERIDQIRHENVPEGYKKTKTGILPVDWATCTIDECLERVEHPVDVQADEVYTQIGIRSHGKGLFYKEPVTGEALGNKSVFWIEPNCFVLNIVFAWEQAIGKTTQSEVGMIGSHRFPMYRPVDGKIDIDYLFSYLMTKQGKDILEAASPGGAGRNRTLGQDRFMKSKIVLPTPEEQKKIAEILTTQDKVIELEGRKIEEIKKAKQFFLSKMFPKKGQSVPEIRFKGFTDAWERCKVGELIEDYSQKTMIQNQYPVLTSSQQQGIVLQEDYFADRQVTTDDNIGYFVLPYGYFTYRSRSDTDVFVFNRNNLIEKGIISYYYPVFAPRGCDSNFLLRRLNYGIRKQLAMAAEGTGQKVLAHNKFKNMIVDVPSRDEQKQIGALFETLDHLITLHQRKLEEEKKKKKALMQLLLTGIVRVPAG